MRIYHYFVYDQTPLWVIAAELLVILTVLAWMMATRKG